MATDKQIAANRLNAQTSTGPRTENGKRRSRRNAFRHGLTAETIINVVENAADYRKLEARLKADFHPQTTIEQQLVARLASLLWRLRRATAIESGLFQIQTKILRDRRAHLNSIYATDKTRLNIFYELIPSLSPPPQPNLESRVDERDIEVGLNQQADEIFGRTPRYGSVVLAPGKSRQRYIRTAWSVRDALVAAACTNDASDRPN